MCPDFPKVGGASAAEVAAAILVDPATDKIDGSKVDASVAAVQAKTDLIPADITTQLDTNIPAVMAKTNIIGASVALETAGNLAAVKTKTDALPTDPADESLLEAAIATRASATDYNATRAAKIDKIQDFLEEGFGILTADGSEQIVREYVGLGKIHAYIDLTNMVAGNSTTIRQSMKIKTAGGYVKYAEETYSGVQSLPLLHIIMKPGKFGVKITLQQAAVVYKTYDWETLVEQAAA